MTTRILFGGTFDPIHNGHLRMALELAELMQTPVQLMPLATPGHRPGPAVSAEHRLQMLNLAVADEPMLDIEDCELRRTGTTFTVDTLEAIRAQHHPSTPIAIVMGSDAFAGFASWHRWQDIPQLAHLILVQRPGAEIQFAGPLAELSRRVVNTPEGLSDCSAGMLLPVTLSLLDISSTDIRQRLSDEKSIRYLVPDAVLEYICQQGLYS